MKDTFTDPNSDPAKVIAEAKRVVAIATEAEDAAFMRAVSIIESYQVKPGTCAHKSKTLTRGEVRHNDLIKEMSANVRRLVTNDIPF